MSRRSPVGRAGLRWYREPLVWLLVAIPASAVVMGVVMIWLAVSTDDGLVADDYYRRGLQINRVLDRDAAAASLALGADLELDPGASEVRVALAARHGFEAPARLYLAFYHATRAGLDRSVTLERRSQGGYQAVLTALPRGPWNVELGTGRWRLTGRLAPRPGEPARLHLGAS